MIRMMVLGVAVAYGMAVLQSTVGGRLAVAGVAPDLLLVWTISMGLACGGLTGAVTGWAGGLIQGGLQQKWIGAYAISKTVSGFIAGRLGAKMFKENWLAPMVCAALVTVLNEGVFLLFSRSGPWEGAWRVVGVRVVYHAVLAPFFFAAAYRLQRAVMRGQEEQV
jgi:rod shape-determining protein MreD